MIGSKRYTVDERIVFAGVDIHSPVRTAISVLSYACILSTRLIKKSPGWGQQPGANEKEEGINIYSLIVT